MMQMGWAVCVTAWLLKAGWIFYSCFRVAVCPWILYYLLCVSPKEPWWGGPPACRELSGLLLFELMWALGLTAWPFSPCETSHTLKQIQFTAQRIQKPRRKTEKVLLFLRTGCCGNKQQRAASHFCRNCAAPFSPGLTPVWVRAPGLNSTLLSAVEYVVHVRNSVQVEEVKCSCSYVLVSYCYIFEVL